MIQLITIWDKHDNELILPFHYGKNGKKRTKPQPVKLTAFQKLKLYVKGALRYGD